MIPAFVYIQASPVSPNRCRIYCFLLATCAWCSFLRVTDNPLGDWNSVKASITVELIISVNCSMKCFLSDLILLQQLASLLHNLFAILVYDSFSV